MDTMERVLQDDLNRLSDRLAAGLSGDTAAGVRLWDPDLYQRLEAVSGRLADLRQDLTDRYAAWLLALDECEALWAAAEAGAPADRVMLDRAA
jgi:hypothetical protein